VIGFVLSAKITILQTRRYAIVLDVKSLNQEVGAEEEILVDVEVLVAQI